MPNRADTSGTEDWCASSGAADEVSCGARCTNYKVRSPSSRYVRWYSVWMLVSQSLPRQSRTAGYNRGEYESASHSGLRAERPAISADI